MDDRDLLEQAAKAAGIPFVEGKPVKFDECGFYEAWNSLISDTDAMGLSVVLRLDVNYFFDEVHVNRSHPHPKVDIVEDLGTDELATTRRAITRAAAALGEGA